MSLILQVKSLKKTRHIYFTSKGLVMITFGKSKEGSEICGGIDVFLKR